MLATCVVVAAISRVAVLVGSDPPMALRALQQKNVPQIPKRMTAQVMISLFLLAGGLTTGCMAISLLADTGPAYDQTLNR